MKFWFSIFWKKQFVNWSFYLVKNWSTILSYLETRKILHLKISTSDRMSLTRDRMGSSYESSNKSDLCSSLICPNLIFGSSSSFSWKILLWSEINVLIQMLNLGSGASFSITSFAQPLFVWPSIVGMALPWP